MTLVVFTDMTKNNRRSIRRFQTEQAAQKFINKLVWWNAQCGYTYVDIETLKTYL